MTKLACRNALCATTVALLLGLMGCSSGAENGAGEESNGGEQPAQGARPGQPIVNNDSAPVGYGTVGQSAARAQAEAEEAAAAQRAMEPPPDGASLSALLDNQEMIQYPADRTAVLAGCGRDTHCSQENLSWLSAHLPEAEYSSAAEVRAALGL